MNKRNYFIGMALLLLLVGIGGLWQYNRPARNLENEDAAFAMPAADIYKQFSEDEQKANQQYLDKTIQVQGVLKSVSRGQDGSLNLSLDSGNGMGDVTCEVPDTNIPEGAALQVGQPVAIKGQCTGYLTDVVLVKCVILP
jgi:hypothetical protein